MVRAFWVSENNSIGAVVYLGDKMVAFGKSKGKTDLNTAHYITQLPEGLFRYSDNPTLKEAAVAFFEKRPPRWLKTLVYDCCICQSKSTSMILTFSKDDFITQIKQGIKIHTIRDDPKLRWRPAMSIQMWRGNPRNTRSSVLPFQFDERVCICVEEVRIRRIYECDAFPYGIVIEVKKHKTDPGRIMTPEMTLKLAQNDGLSIQQLRDWFVPDMLNVYQGRIIHWTDFLYSN